MAKVAEVKLRWTKSPSTDVDHVDVVVNNAGTETTTTFGNEVEELMVVVRASTALTFRVDTFDAEGNVATSASYSFSLGDLEAPLPATNLRHEVVAVRDEAPPTPPPTP